MLPRTIISLEHLGGEIEQVEARLELWRDRLDRALAAQDAGFRSGATVWSESREALSKVQRLVNALSDEVEALKALRPLVHAEKRRPV